LGLRIRRVILEWFHTFEPEQTKERKANRLKRKQFWAAGINDLWAIDQHDKWQRFGLRLHLGLEPYSGKILWLRIWWSNSNPKLICRYYLDVARALGGVSPSIISADYNWLLTPQLEGIPLVTQSDPGTENYGVANAQTFLRHLYDARLGGTIQHQFMRKKKNVKPEIAWSHYRQQCAPGFEMLIDEGVHTGLYDIDDPLHTYVSSNKFCAFANTHLSCRDCQSSLIFRYVFIPWLQLELDNWVTRFNETKKRKDPKKLLPCDRPDIIFENPERFQASDFKVCQPPSNGI
jgi:hypothetical protein